MNDDDDTIGKPDGVCQLDHLESHAHSQIAQEGRGVEDGMPKRARSFVW